MWARVALDSTYFPRSEGICRVYRRIRSRYFSVDRGLASLLIPADTTRRPPTGPTHESNERRNQERAHDERVDEDAGGQRKGDLPEGGKRHEGEHREARGKSHAGHGDGAACPRRCLGHGPAERGGPCLSPDLPGQEDRVVGPEGHKQHSRRERDQKAERTLVKP